MIRLIPSRPLLLLLATLFLLCQCATPPRRSEVALPRSTGAERWTRVTGALAAATPADDRGRPIAWRFSVRAAPGINARSWPGGRVEINEGTLKFVRNDGELAAVLAHEMAHVTGGHHRQQLREAWTNFLAGAALVTLLTHEGLDGAPAIALASGAALTVNVTALAARRRTRELEADRLSLDLLRRVGYPPSAAVEFWERYAVVRKSNGQANGHWWQSHPADDERVRRLRELAAGR